MSRSHQKKNSNRKKIINFFRGLLKVKIAENILYRFTRGRHRRSLSWKLVPPEYLYPEKSLRLVCRDNIFYELDLSNFNDHFLFFGDVDPHPLYLFSIIRPEFIVMDVGSNIGFTSLNFAKRCPNGKVYSYEPDTPNYQRLCRNVELNKVSNIQPIKKGIGESKREVKLIKHPHHSGMNRIVSSSNAIGDFEIIDIVSLDDEIHRLRIEKLDLIKIDVEGYEWHVLQGAAKTIHRFRPILFIELIERNIRPHGHSTEALLNWLTQLDYSVIDVKTRLPIQRIDGKEVETDILCFPNNISSE